MNRRIESRARPAAQPATVRGRFSLKALTAVTIWGLSFVATRLGLQSFSPTVLVTTRLILAALTLWVIARARGDRLDLPAGDGRRCALLGATLAGHLLIQNVGLLKTTATHTGWIIGFCPITIAIGARLFLKERLGSRGWLGILAGTTGIAVICGSSGLDLTEATTGDLLQVSSCGTWAVFTLLAVAPIARNGALRVTVRTTLVASAIALPFAAVSLRPDGAPTLQSLLAVLFLGIVCSGAAYWLWYAAIREVGSTSAGTYLYLEPFVTWAAAAFVLGERMTPLGLAGGGLVLIGVWIVAWARPAGDRSS